ncbi:MAG TPA: acyl transferase [Sphingobacteriaceae bacterium]
MFPADQIFSISNPSEFEARALQIFRIQARQCPIYRQFIENLNREPSKIQKLDDIPFLPIEFFKSHEIISGPENVDIVFSSSGTTGMATSKHYVTDVSLYERSFMEGFKYFYGDIQDYTILALLPSYLEREGSSLIYMVDSLIHESGNPESGYFLYDHDALFAALEQQKLEGRKTLLIGVTYALLDFIEKYRMDFPQLIIMETGGMKGKRPEMLREELHHQLKEGFGVTAIHSEYGMTELLSQAYSKGEGIFACPPWMKVMIRDTNDPLTTLPHGRTGGLNIIDLANLNSCSFIATQDLGKTLTDGTFEVLGRFDNSDIRGCNLLVQ